MNTSPRSRSPDQAPLRWLAWHPNGFLINPSTATPWFSTPPGACGWLPLDICAGRPRLTHDLPAWLALLDPTTAYPNLAPLRQLLSEAPAADLPQLARAQQLGHWWQAEQYCSHCGQATVLHPAELAFTCINQHPLRYPTFNPCVMVLITRGQHCLLARHHRSRAGQFSCLAGFIEAGENAEETVHREVLEEVGLRIDSLRYAASQNWPFASQLMLGFYANYAAGDIQLDTAELQEARWFSAETLREPNLPYLPAKGTLSRRLIDGFVDSCVDGDKPAAL